MSQSTQDLANREYTVKIEQYFSRGWELFKQYALPFVGYMLLVTLITSVASRLPYPLGFNEDNRGGIVNFLLSPPLTAGYYIVGFLLAKGRTPVFGDFFKGFNKYLQLLLVNIVGSLLIMIGLLLLVIPGLYLLVAYCLAIPFVVEKHLDFWTALETSRKLVTKKWFSFLGLGVLLVLLNFAGALFLGIGLLVTIPLTFCIVVATFEDIVGLNGTSAELLDT